MSDTANEFEKTGSNYPDRQDADGATDTPKASEPSRDAAEPTHVASGIGVIDGQDDDGSDHYGSDRGRDTLTTGESQRALSGEQEQNLPSMDQNNASEVDKVAGIVAQTRSDAATQSIDQVTHILKQRFEQSGISLPDDEIAELAKQVTTGDA